MTGRCDLLETGSVPLSMHAQVSAQRVVSLSMSQSLICPPTHTQEPMEAIQGVVTYMSPVEAFVTRFKIFDGQKVCLIA